MTPPASSEAPSEDSLVALTALAEPTRRALYAYVVSTGDWTGRDQASAALGVERATAAHHLDRLAADGLLEVTFQRLSDRRGPGAGRTAKLYRRAARTFEVSLPPRDYELAARLLAGAADAARTEHVDVTVALEEAARHEGRRIAEAVRAPSEDTDAASARASIVEVLTAHGYEPRTTVDGTIVLTNCPFLQLATAHTQLVCGMNLNLLGALSDDVAAASLVAALEPSEGCCCVRLHCIQP
jgi:predicted ArsR family transcriptional regulator